jgi:inner membrane protein
MASLGHVAVGLAAARFHERRAPDGLSFLAAGFALSLLSLAPDADVIGFAFGVHYGDPWGHRGATHSLVFAGALALVAALAAHRLFRLSFAKSWALVAAVVASHGLLDSLTDGGLGVALLWPFSNERFFAPWRPIPVAPIGLAFLSSGGLIVALTELWLFSPFLVYALVPRRRPER